MRQCLQKWRPVQSNRPFTSKKIENKKNQLIEKRYFYLFYTNLFTISLIYIYDMTYFLF